MPPLRPLRAVSSSDWSPEYTADKAVDDDPNTRWNSAPGHTTGEWLELDFPATTRFNRTSICQGLGERIVRYKIQYWNGAAWADAFRGEGMALDQSDVFPAVASSKVRLLVEQCAGAGDAATPTVAEFAAYDDPREPRRSKKSPSPWAIAAMGGSTSVLTLNFGIDPDGF